MTIDNDQQPAGVRRSLILSFAERYASIVINLGATAILARLLTPRDYGVYTIAVVVVGIAATFRDFGVISFLIQEKNLTEGQVRTAYGVSLLIGVAAGGVIAIFSGPLGAFYGNDGVSAVLRVLAVTFVLMPFGSAVLALLRREMNFTALLWISLGSTLASVAVSILLALADDGYMSLAWGSLAGTVVTCVLAAAWRPRQFNMVPSLAAWRRITSFGVVATAGILVDEIGSRAPELVIGRLLGVSPVGLFGRADGITTMFNRMVTSAVAPVVVAAFAQQHRIGNPLKDQFLGAMALLTGIAWPFFAFLALMTAPVFHILFGAGWDRAIPICRILCIAASIRVLADLNGLVIQSMGQVKWNLAAQLVTQPVAIVLVIGAAFFNLVAVAGALIVAASVSVVVFYRVVDRLIGASLEDMLRRSLKSAGVTVCSVAAPALVVLLMRTDGDNVWLPLMVAGLGAAAGWLIGVSLFRHDLRTELLGLMAKVSLRPAS